MKRTILFTALVLLMLVAVVACSTTTAPAGTTGTDLKGKEVKVAVENAYPPFNFIDKKSNKGAGWDYDAWTEICKRLNCKPTFVEAAWEGIFEAAAAGKYDVVADGITITDERKKTVAFSDSYLKYGQAIMVRADDANIKDADSLKKATGLVGTQLGTTNETKAIELVGEKRVKSFDTFDAAAIALMGKSVDAVIIDEPAAMGFLAANKGKLKITSDRLTSEDLGFVFQKTSTLIPAVNGALAAMKKDGTLDALYKKWFVDFVPGQ